MTRFRWRWGAATSLAMAATAGIVFFGSGARPAAIVAQQAVPVRVATVHLVPADDVARYAAVVRPRIEADLGFRVAGKIVERLVDTGQRVERGTPLARLDPSDLALQASSTEAQLVSARADAANAAHDFARYSELRQGQWTTQQEFDKRKAAMDTAAAKVRQLEAELKVARNNAEYTTLLADGPAVVTAVLAEPGTVVSAGQAVFHVARLGEVEIAANLPEQKVAGLSAAELGVEFWSLPGQTVKGRLRELSPAADATTRTYTARITLVDPPPDVRLGMTATLVVTRPRPGIVAAVPMTALTKDGDKPAVWALNPAGDGLELHPVQVAAFAGDQAILAAGVAEGQRIVTAGVQKLDAGLKVRIWTEPER